MGLAGTLWDFLGLYGAVWDCTGLSGTSGTLHFLPIPDKSTFVEKISHTGPRKKIKFFQNLQFLILFAKNLDLVPA